jgi:hypothetical protein
MDRPYSDYDRGISDTGPSENAPRTRDQGSFLNLGKLQIAGLLLIIVFIWGVISAVTIAMFEIDPPALTEFVDDGKGDISGYVRDEDGIHLANVTVNIHGTAFFTNTNSEGFYTIENVKEGNYEVEATLFGYGTVTKRVTIDSTKPLMVDFILEEGGLDKTINERRGSNLSDLRNLNQTTAFFIVIYGSFAFLGGILAFLQRYYWIAMFGALCGVISGALSIGFIIAPILSIIALIFILSNQEEFITSETSYIDRLFGVRRAEMRPVAIPRGSPKKLQLQAPPPPMAKAAKPSYVERGPPPVPAYPTGPMEPPMAPPVAPPMAPMPQRDPRDISKPSPTCIACKGSIRVESQGIQCQCGVFYHRFCANSTSICKNCGSPL